MIEYVYGCTFLIKLCQGRKIPEVPRYLTSPPPQMLDSLKKLFISVLKDQQGFFCVILQWEF